MDYGRNRRPVPTQGKPYSQGANPSTYKAAGGGGAYKYDGPVEEPLDPQNLKLGRYKMENDSIPDVSEEYRYAARDATRNRVLRQLCRSSDLDAIKPTARFQDNAFVILRRLTEGVGGKDQLPPGVRKQISWSMLFTDERSKESVSNENREYLLPKFDVIAVPARADYNSSFVPMSDAGSQFGNQSSESSHIDDSRPDCEGPGGFTGWFWTLHVGAPNIGESSRAEDFQMYSVGRSLNENMYLRDMKQLWGNAILAMRRLRIEDGIIFPFGMGAFLRHLGKCDDRYNDASTMRQLRRNLADQFIAAIIDLFPELSNTTGNPTSSAASTADASRQDARGGAKAAKGRDVKAGKGRVVDTSSQFPRRLHLCLIVTDGGESVENHNVFLEAAAEGAEKHPALMQKLLLCRNVEVLQLAHDLATASAEPLKVGILNGANRKMLGNHWFEDGARFAIDENLHRRSASMTRMAVLLNMGTQPTQRKPTELADHLNWLGGRVVKISDPTVGPGPDKKKAETGGGVMCPCRRRNKTENVGGKQQTQKGAENVGGKQQTQKAAAGKQPTKKAAAQKMQEP